MAQALSLIPTPTPQAFPQEALCEGLRTSPDQQDDNYLHWEPPAPRHQDSGPLRQGSLRKPDTARHEPAQFAAPAGVSKRQLDDTTLRQPGKQHCQSTTASTLSQGTVRSVSDPARASVGLQICPTVPSLFNIQTYSGGSEQLCCNSLLAVALHRACLTPGLLPAGMGFGPCPAVATVCSSLQVH